MKQVLSWEEAHLESKAPSKPSSNKDHLKDWHKEALANPKHEQLQQHAEEYNKDLDHDHIEAIHSYVLDSGPVNQFHRTGKYFNGWMDDTIHHDTKHLDKVTQHSTKHPTVVYRGIHHSMRNLKPGTQFKDKGFVSTSLDKHSAKNVANEYNEYPKEKSTVARIFLPEGSKGNYLNTLPDLSDYKEYLLPRNQHFKVLGHSTDKNGLHTIDMELHHPKGKK
jgi:hypothetical protein